MKKITLAILLGMFTFGCAFSQMSFNGSKLSKSAFSLTTASEEKSVKENTPSDAKVLITDESEELTKSRKRRSSRGGSYSNCIRTNPLSMIFGYYGLSFEHKLADNMSAGLTLGLYSHSISLSLGGAGTDWSYSGFEINPEFRYYFSSAIEGFYASPFLDYTTITEKISENDGTTTTTFSNTISLIGGGAGIGKQWVWGGFALDLFVGIKYQSVSYKYDANYTTVVAGGASYGGVSPSFGASIGYAF